MALSLPAKKSFLIWACILLCLVPFVILSFFNFIAYDDYAAVGAFDKYGFWETQKMIYLHWEGRFTATFLCGVCEKAGILTRYYFLVFFLFAFFTWAAIFYLLDSINTYFLGRTFGRAGLALAGLILFVMDIYVMVEMSSGIYWFSPTAVYQTSFILFLVLMGSLVRRLAGGGDRPVSVGAPGGRVVGSMSRRAIRWDIALVILSILLCGSNEVMTIALACFFILLMLGYRYYDRPIPRSLFLYLCVVLLTGVIIISTSGILSYRGQVVMKGHTGYAGVVMILFFRGLSLFYFVLKEPLFWACAFASFVLGMRAALIPSLSGVVDALKSKRFFIPGLAAVALLILLALAPILLVTHGSIPDRALNDLTSVAAFGLLVMVFLLGLCNPSLAKVILPLKYLSSLLLFFIACGLFASSNYKEAWKNVFSGYFYHAIQTDRQKIFIDARERQQHITTIPSYEMALDEKVRRVFPHGVPVTVQHLFRERPTLLYFDNEAEDLTGRYLHQYYQLDSILVQPRP